MAHAQVLPAIDAGNVTSLVQPGEEAMRVTIWGNVSRPGRFDVRKDIDLLDLLYMIGGPNDATRGRRDREKTKLRIVRHNETGWYTAYEARLDSVLAFEKSYPDLVHGDLIQVETIVRDRLGWRDALQFAVLGLQMAILLERLFRE